MSRLTYEPAQPTDGAAVLTLLRAADLPTEDLTADSWLHFVVARSGDHVRGAAGLEPAGPDALVRSLVVSPASRSNGVGTCLLAQIEDLARRQNFARTYLLTTTAAPFFVRHGYTVIDREQAPPAIQQTTEFGSLCPASAAVLVKSLNGAADPAR